ncbi:winged helix-turn-helix domain-containing protein [Kitasatospora kifunensis]|uniref:DNA-binding response OmpR family regulator n=1 Tax=Kitasatospora kifunensis TaxID=58351 RepID=A0A7W7VYV4_KITKI|nr:DNA-binding response OmpR family regulator [Kitasatospora kifunensis]
MVVHYPRPGMMLAAHPEATAVRRTGHPWPTATVATDRLPGSGLSVDTEQRTVTVDGKALELTYMEFELLAHLVAHPRRVHSRRHLMETVWGRSDNGDTRTISTHIARLRRKLGPDLRTAIATVRQIGYKYDPRLADTA